MQPLPRRRSGLRHRVPWAALLPLALTVGVAYVGTVLWSLRISVSSSRSFPLMDFVGLQQYERLFTNTRWLESLQHLALYGILFVPATLALGFVLAVFIDQKLRAEGVLRTIFLYPYAMSFVATGLAWQWLFHPDMGLPRLAHDWGLGSGWLDWLVDPDRVMWTLVVATTWQAAGLVMALVLAGLRQVDNEIWMAARLDGVPRWRVYGQVVLPMLGPTMGTAFVLLSAGAVKLFDAVVAMTQGGPGTASDVPARFIMDHLFGRSNLALASAGAITLLVMVLSLAVPLRFARQLGDRPDPGAARVELAG